MTPEELMRPRYKVIADYPGSRFEVGHILYRYYFETSNTDAYAYVSNRDIPLQGGVIKKEYAESMPHLFKPLQWWEDRRPDEMPCYLKYKLFGSLYKATYEGARHPADAFCQNNDGFGWLSLNDMEPATCEEYEQYNQQKK